MRLCNPINYWVNGNETEPFTFEVKQGSELYYVGISQVNWIASNMLVFATSEGHAKQILISAIHHSKECAIKYNESEQWDKSERYKWDDLLKQLETGEGETFTVNICKAPMNQFFKTAWASNDTCLSCSRIN